MDTMETNKKGGPVWAIIFIVSIIGIFEAVSELENFSRNGKRGLMMGTVKYIVKPVNNLAGATGKRPLRGSDLDFPPEPDSLADDNRLYADSVIGFGKADK